MGIGQFVVHIMIIHCIYPTKTTKSVVIRRVLGVKMVKNALAPGAPPRTPLGSLERSPDSLGGLRGGEGREMGMGRGKGERKKERGGRGDEG